MTSTHRRARKLAVLVLALGLAPAARAAAPEVVVLSNRADLISGGDALVEVKVPAYVNPALGVKVLLNGASVTGAFKLRADGRYYGLVTGLRVGDNVLQANTIAGSARITITNHPIGGPIFSGPQVQPWVCQTTNSPSLGPPLDAQCNAPTAFRYMYRNLSNQFVAYDPGNPPPASSIKTITTDAGVTVPYIVRIERGTMDRGIHEIAVLADPGKAWAPWSPLDQPGWNHKLFIPFGSGCEFSHSQGNPGSVLSDTALSRGFMVASSSNTQYGTHCNDVLAAETVMMLKEHIVETYGFIRYTMSNGVSGGSHLQNLINANYPGLLQGSIPGQNFQDTWTPYREFGDCGLLARLYAAGQIGATWTEAQKAAIDGHANASTCAGPINTYMASRTQTYLGPTVSTGCQGNSWTWSTTNLTGQRCTLQDYQAAVFGSRAPDASDPVGYAKRPYDNTGLQYGLVALNSGVITPQIFVDLNVSIGCYDINAVWQPQRCVADPGSVEIAYASGRVANAKQHAKVAWVDMRDNDYTEEHYVFRSYVSRNRMLRENGTAANRPIWRIYSVASTVGGNSEDLPFDTLNQWLANVEADLRNVPLEQKIIDDRPAAAVDQCVNGTGTNPVFRPGSDCDAVFVVRTDTRVAAGEPQTSDIMKCQLKPLVRADYTVTFTDAQWAALQGVFPTGVCDWSKPSVGQVTPQPWLTFANGPGGDPLGNPPVSTP